MSKRAILLSAVAVLAAVIVFYEWKKRTPAPLPPIDSAGTPSGGTSAGAGAPLAYGIHTSDAIEPTNPRYPALPRDPTRHDPGLAGGKQPYTGLPASSIQRDPTSGNVATTGIYTGGKTAWYSGPTGSFSRV